MSAETGVAPAISGARFANAELVAGIAEVADRVDGVGCLSLVATIGVAGDDIYHDITIGIGTQGATVDRHR